MNKPNKVNAVYLELSRALGDTLSVKELLIYAQSIVEVFEHEHDPRCEIRVGGLPRDNQALNAAYFDNEWKILSEEMKLHNIPNNDDWEGVSLDLLAGKFDIEVMLNQLRY